MTKQEEKTTASGASLLTLAVVLVLLILALIFGLRTPPDATQLPVFRRSADFEVQTVRTMTQADLAQGNLVLVNYAYAYDPDAAPDLVTVFANKTDAYQVRDSALQLSGVAMEPLNQWLGDFYGKTELNSVNVIAGHRTIADQQALYDRALQTHGADHVAAYFNDPGHSEHHAGLAVDFATFDTQSQTSGDFTGEGEYAWLLENAWRYGFIQRYPPEKQAVTGIGYESWHFRYVGVPHAWYMQKNDLVLEEYLELLRQCSVEKPLTFKADRHTYQVYYCAGLEIPLPDADDYTISGDNVGGFIVTVKIK